MHIAALSTADGFGETVAAIGRTLGSLGVAYDPRRRLVTTTLAFDERPCFTVGHLEDYRTLYDGLILAMRDIPFEDRPVRFVLHTSGEPGFWCLGGDLDLFARCIRGNDPETLRAYGYECLRSGHLSHTGLGMSVVTICLVQGKALGGGFESARSCNVLFAEEQSVFGLPEINFNMFPGMGAFSYIAERMGLRRVEEMMLSAEMRTAAEMHALGAVDHLAPEGGGLDAVHAFIDRHGKRFSGLAAMMEARRLSMRIDIEAMHRVVDAWVDCAFRIGPNDLRMMERLVGAQRRLRPRAPVLEVA